MRIIAITFPYSFHGYDYALASGRGYRFLTLEFTGPWLEPAFTKKGHQEIQKNNEVIRMIIDKYNVALCHVAKQFAENNRDIMPFYFLDFRGEVKKNWKRRNPTQINLHLKHCEKLNDIITDFHGLSRREFNFKYSNSGLPCIKDAIARFLTQPNPARSCSKSRLLSILGL